MSVLNHIVSFIEKADDSEGAKVEGPAAFSPDAQPVEGLQGSETPPPPLSGYASGGEENSRRRVSSSSSQTHTIAMADSPQCAPQIEQSPREAHAPATPPALSPSAYDALTQALLERDEAVRQQHAAELFAGKLEELIVTKDAALLAYVAATGTADDSGDKEAARGQATAALGNPSDVAILRLETLVEANARHADAAAACLRTARAGQAELQQHVVALQSDLAIATAKANAREAETAELEASCAATKREVRRLMGQAADLRSALERQQIEIASQARELDVAAAQILHRDNELAIARHEAGTGHGGSAPLRLIRQQPVLRAVAGKHRVGSGIVSIAERIDSVGLAFGRLLRAHAGIRLLTLLYLVVVHVYVFNLVWVFLHHSGHMPDHMGDDVHDHIANHVHHTTAG